jgi:hypothetical protein
LGHSELGGGEERDGASRDEKPSQLHDIPFSIESCGLAIFSTLVDEFLPVTPTRFCNTILTLPEYRVIAMRVAMDEAQF